MTSEKFSISSAIFIYIGSRFLPEQMANIAVQTSLPDELVVYPILNISIIRLVDRNSRAVQLYIFGNWMQGARLVIPCRNAMVHPDGGSLGSDL